MYPHTTEITYGSSNVTIINGKKPSSSKVYFYYNYKLSVFLFSIIN